MNRKQHRLAAECAAWTACSVLMVCLGCSSDEQALQSAAEQSDEQNTDQYFSMPVELDSAVDTNGNTFNILPVPDYGLPEDSATETFGRLPGEPASTLESLELQVMPGAPQPEQNASVSRDIREQLVPGIAGASSVPRRQRVSGEAANGDNVRAIERGRTEAQTLRRQPLAWEQQPGEELWVIAAAESSDADDGSTDRGVSSAEPAVPGCGALLARRSEESELIPVPLQHTEVTGTIDGYIASVNVQQQFRNPFDSKIEAVYLFPLPQKAAVNEFIMTIGDRRIRGIIRERKEAEQIYRRAQSHGHVASLLTQQRPNVFTQKVANIEPGKRIDIDIRYFNTLRWDDGEYEFVFPMVVGPRFNPAGSDDPLAAVARGAAVRSPQASSVEYLAPNERSGHDISLSIDVRAGVDIERIHSVNHVITTTSPSPGHRQVRLTESDRVPNKDFVLRYRVAGDSVKSALMTHRDEHGQYFTMMLYPPAELTSLQRSPMEMVFVLDCSGSMDGRPLAQTQAAVRHALQMLTPRDSFQMIRFSSNASQLGSKPLPATEQNIRRGLAWLEALNGGGGTQMIEGIKAALDFPHDEGRFRLVTFLTDGYIGNEQQILTTLHQKLGSSRIFSFGVGQSPNRYLMDRMALVGRGAVTYLSLNDDAASVMNRFTERISHPALTDITINWGEMQVTDVYPSRLPDLVTGRPIVITGRYTGEPSTVRVGGLACMQPVDYEVSIVNDQQDHPGIAAVWARHRIADLMSQATRSPDLLPTIRQSVLQTALNHSLMSSWTAFIAVDSLSKTDGEFGTTVAVPVPVPEGVRYETTVGPEGKL